VAGTVVPPPRSDRGDVEKVEAGFIEEPDQVLDGRLTELVEERELRDHQLDVCQKPARTLKRKHFMPLQIELQQRAAISGELVRKQVVQPDAADIGIGLVLIFLPRNMPPVSRGPSNSMRTVLFSEVNATG
jgi:hypothetical protein